MTNLSSRWLTWSLGTAALIGVSVYPLTARTARADVGDHAPVRLEKNPRIHAALDALRAAKHELQDAPHDFHGKKADAIEAIDHAIEKLDEIKDW